MYRTVHNFICTILSTALRWVRCIVCSVMKGIICNITGASCCLQRYGCVILSTTLSVYHIVYNIMGVLYCPHMVVLILDLMTVKPKTLLVFYITYNIMGVSYCPQSHTWWSWFWTWWQWSCVIWDETSTSPQEIMTNSWIDLLFLSLWVWWCDIHQLDACLAVSLNFSGVSVRSSVFKPRLLL